MVNIMWYVEHATIGTYIVVYMVIADGLIGRHDDPAYRNYPTYAYKFVENHGY